MHNQRGKHTIWSDNKAFFIIIISCMALAIVGMVAWFTVIHPYLQKPKSQVRYSLVREHDAWKQVDKSKTLDRFSVNGKQYILTYHGRNQDCMNFIGDGAKAKHTIKTVIAFGDTKSRNYILQEHPVMRMGIRSGYINASFCFVQTTNEYSVLATEALAESDYNNPSKTWDVLYDLMLTDTSGLTTTQQRLNAIMAVLDRDGTAKVQGKPQITTQSLRNGTFYQWGYAMSTSQKADYIPAIFMDNKVINQSVSVYDPDAMWKYVKHLS